ncbi:MAG TPA: TIGR03617 family F420-dependent LLM class oxidoreductase [Sporichthyaceae bacterium]|jgi:probable F420-dependent oxidoreductase|nr:TIGR03617 family F420-dependent LLM class oxidoreductase [Sporichthyaceae bacterium]
MRVDTGLTAALADAGAAAARAEADGFEGVWGYETNNDPFLPLAFAAQATSTVELGTGIALAFARSPMTTAYSAWDLQRLSNGRFILGLGSQIKPHIERRFSMPWSRPAARMREYVAALRAIWTCWQDGTKLDFAGEFYTHNLMPPHFNPGPIPSGAPPVFLAAVGDAMTRTAAEVADGILLHRFTTVAYLAKVTLPALEAGRPNRDPNLAPIQIALPAFVVVGDTEEQIAAGMAATRRQIAFYGSTPAYRPVLDQHGWGELQPELQQLTREDRWAQMDALITDEIVAEFAPIGTPEDAGAELRRRFAGMVERLSLAPPGPVDPDLLARLAAAVRREG